MKFYPPRFFLLTALGLVACGQPGPLYLPDNPPPGLRVTKDRTGPAPIPERDIDEAPPPLDAAPPKPAEQKPNESEPTSQNPQP